MTPIEMFLSIVLLILGLILIVLIILQSGRVKNLGSSIVGTSNVDLFEHKKRGGAKWLHYITIVLVVLFVLIAFILVFV